MESLLLTLSFLLYKKSLYYTIYHDGFYTLLHQILFCNVYISALCLKITLKVTLPATLQSKVTSIWRKNLTFKIGHFFHENSFERLQFDGKNPTFGILFIFGTFWWFLNTVQCVSIISHDFSHGSYEIEPTSLILCRSFADTDAGQESIQGGNVGRSSSIEK